MTKWISVYDSLPKDKEKVMAIMKDSDNVFTMRFDPTYGWTDETSSVSVTCSQGRRFEVLFWSSYLIPQ